MIFPWSSHVVNIVVGRLTKNDFLFIHNIEISDFDSLSNKVNSEILRGEKIAAEGIKNLQNEFTKKLSY